MCLFEYGLCSFVACSFFTPPSVSPSMAALLRSSALSPWPDRTQLAPSHAVSQQEDNKMQARYRQGYYREGRPRERQMTCKGWRLRPNIYSQPAVETTPPTQWACIEKRQITRAKVMAVCSPWSPPRRVA
ncbi:hypothetical protein VTK73DRAFT_4119 [Phialemonium thermophilum]|uniref:Secreted protein n=1 Tax=Phialemonium thermophilum TaxID=223376 RepID=A0ABR3WVW3_9PEZI